MELKDKVIGVLMGGWSPEREISLKSGNKVAESLRKQGIKVMEIDVGHNPSEVRQALSLLMEIDIAFIALHGVPGEDGSIQGILDVLSIPYTGSGVMASSICMNKIITKKVLMSSGIRVPKYIVPRMLSFASSQKAAPPRQWKNIGGGARCHAFGEVHGQWSEDICNSIVDFIKTIKKALGPLPWVVKPISCGSSVGVRLVNEEGELEEALKKTNQQYGDAFIEEFIPGKEVTVGILDDEVLPVAELQPRADFFDYYAKYTPGVTEEIIPAQLPDKIYKEVQEIGLRSHLAVGCKGFSRVDMRIRDAKPKTQDPRRKTQNAKRKTQDAEIYVLEVNSIPGLTDMSVFPAQAAHIGMSYDDVIYKILELAIKER